MLPRTAMVSYTLMKQRRVESCTEHARDPAAGLFGRSARVHKRRGQSYLLRPARLRFREASGAAGSACPRPPEVLAAYPRVFTLTGRRTARPKIARATGVGAGTVRMARNLIMITSILFCAACTAQAPSVPQAPTVPPAGQRERPALTIYNQDFAVVREVVPLVLQPGVNKLSYSGMTAHLEPDSVILRDPSGAHRLQILEQNYRNDPITQQRLLDLYEGQTIEFTRERPDLSVVRIRGRIV